MAYVKGLLQKLEPNIHAKTVIITTGTFLRGEIIIGELKYESGPNNQQPSINLSDTFTRTWL